MNTICHYTYDALDRWTGQARVAMPSAQRFYRAGRLATEIQGDENTRFFEHQTLPLAQLQGDATATLLAVDAQMSVLFGFGERALQNKRYSPYGDSPMTSLLGFNGEQPDTLTGDYHLGQGHRCFKPKVMRFNRPDELSPFGKGGLNAYAYCLGDPVNRSDPTGNFSMAVFGKLLRMGRRYKAIEKMAVLKNKDVDTLGVEVADARLSLNDKDMKIKFITDQTTLDNILAMSEEYAHKWVVLKSNHLVMGIYKVNVDPTHAAIAAIASKRLNVPNEVVAAGMTNRGKLTNYSGHYLPRPSTLSHVKHALRQRGIEIRTEKLYSFNHMRPDFPQ